MCLAEAQIYPATGLVMSGGGGEATRLKLSAIYT